MLGLVTFEKVIIGLKEKEKLFDSIRDYCCLVFAVALNHY